MSRCNYDQLDLLVCHEVLRGLIPLALRVVIETVRALLASCVGFGTTLEESVNLETLVGEDEGKVECSGRVPITAETDFDRSCHRDLGLVWVLVFQY